MRATSSGASTGKVCARRASSVGEAGAAVATAARAVTSAPSPPHRRSTSSSFPRLERGDDRMLRRVIVLGGVLVLGIVAAAHVAAGPPQAQFHPRVSPLPAFL